jgi:hypothetical protein
MKKVMLAVALVVILLGRFLYAQVRNYGQATDIGNIVSGA